MGRDSTDWAVKANEVIKVLIVRAGRLERQTQVTAVFAPKHTYAIFGVKEEIIGYRDLQIKLYFACFDLYPNIEISWGEKDARIEEGGPQDVRTMMKTWLPKVAFEPKAKLIDHLEEYRASQWTPPGRRLASYRNRGEMFEVWHGQLSDPKVRDLLRNMQIFVLFFIEGGSYIDLDGPEWTLQRWSIFFLYQKASTTVSQPPHELIGYCTTHRFWHGIPFEPRPHVLSMDDPLLPPQVSSARELPCRERISQFIILPPFQRQGHGAHLYEIVVETLVKDASVREITVEDPNEAFDDLRDFGDLIRLRQNRHFARLVIDRSVPLAPDGGPLPMSKLLPQTTLDELRTSYKLASRQFDRLVEMQLLASVLVRVQQVAPPRRRDLGRDPATATANERHYFLWRLLVKQRLYKRNADVLAQMDLPERKIKIEDAIIEQEWDYIRILGCVARLQAARDKHRAESRGQDVSSTTEGDIVPSVENDDREDVEEDGEKDVDYDASDDTESASETLPKLPMTVGGEVGGGLGSKGKFGDVDRVGDDGKPAEGNTASNPLRISSSPPNKRARHS